MNELEVLLHHGLYKAVQESYKGYVCEINTHMSVDCVSVHLMLKNGEVIASVGWYQVGRNEDDFYEQMIGELK